MGKFKNFEKAVFWSADSDEGMYHFLVFCQLNNPYTKSTRTTRNDPNRKERRQHHPPIPENTQAARRPSTSLHPLSHSHLRAHLLSRVRNLASHHQPPNPRSPPNRLYLLCDRNEVGRERAAHATAHESGLPHRNETRSTVYHRRPDVAAQSAIVCDRTTSSLEIGPRRRESGGSPNGSREDCVGVGGDVGEARR